LHRLFDDLTLGMEYDPPEEEEEEDRLFEAPPLIVRLTNHAQLGEETWLPVKVRPVLLAEIAGF